MISKNADDLDKITQASIEAYKSRTNISEEEIKELLDNETWILPSEALEMGFATAIVGETTSDKAAASARKALFNLVKKANQIKIEPEQPEMDTSSAQSQSQSQDPVSDPEPEPQHIENKTKKFFNALITLKIRKEKMKI